MDFAIQAATVGILLVTLLLADHASDDEIDRVQSPRDQDGRVDPPTGH